MTGDKLRVGLIGLGFMGAAMAKRLVGRGWQVTGTDVEEPKVAALAALGGTPAKSAAAVAAESDVVIAIVTSTACVEDAVLGPGGVAEAGSADKVLVDMSTTEAEATRRMAGALAKRCAMPWIDAPVSGGAPLAEEGALAAMAGGEAAVLERAKPVLDDLTARTTLMGPVGAGQVTKMINQVLVLNNFAVLAEALKLGENAGVDVARIPECLGDGYAGSAMLKHLFPRMVARQYEPAAAYARQVLKDLDMVGDLAKKTRTVTPICDQTRMLYRMLIAQGHGEEDAITLLKLYDTDAA